MKVIDKKMPVMVTGGTGYMASWIIKMLLEEGISVNATVRDPLGYSKNRTSYNPGKRIAREIETI